MNAIEIIWNMNIVLRGQATKILCYQLCELITQEFTGATQDGAIRLIACAGLIDTPGTLAPTTISFGDSTGTVTIHINGGESS